MIISVKFQKSFSNFNVKDKKLSKNKSLKTNMSKLKIQEPKRQNVHNSGTKQKKYSNNYSCIFLSLPSIGSAKRGLFSNLYWSFGKTENSSLSSTRNKGAKEKHKSKIISFSSVFLHNFLDQIFILVVCVNFVKKNYNQL